MTYLKITTSFLGQPVTTSLGPFDTREDAETTLARFHERYADAPVTTATIEEQGPADATPVDQTFMETPDIWVALSQATTQKNAGEACGDPTRFTNDPKGAQEYLSQHTPRA